MRNQLVSIMQVAGDLVELAEQVGLKLTPTYNGQLPLMFSSIIWTITKDGRVVTSTTDVGNVINLLEVVHQEYYGLS